MRLVVIVLVLIVGGAAWYLSAIVRGSDELQSKPEWSFLQNFEYYYRQHPVNDTLIIEKKSPYCAAGMIASDGHSRMWVLLAAKNKPLVKKLPDLDYRVTQRDIDRLSSECSVSNEVAAELRSHLAPVVPPTTRG